MPNRRKTKGERELIADIKKATLLLCTKYHKEYGCRDCPLSEYIQEGEDCYIAYVRYIFQKWANK